MQRRNLLKVPVIGAFTLVSTPIVVRTLLAVREGTTEAELTDTHTSSSSSIFY